MQNTHFPTFRRIICLLHTYFLSFSFQSNYNNKESGYVSHIFLEIHVKFPNYTLSNFSKLHRIIWWNHNGSRSNVKRVSECKEFAVKAYIKFEFQRYKVLFFLWYIFQFLHRMPPLYLSIDSLLANSLHTTHYLHFQIYPSIISKLIAYLEVIGGGYQTINPKWPNEYKNKQSTKSFHWPN